MSSSKESVDSVIIHIGNTRGNTRILFCVEYNSINRNIQESNESSNI